MCNNKTIIAFFILLAAQIFVCPGVFSVAMFKACFILIAFSLLLLFHKKIEISFNKLRGLFVFFVLAICATSVNFLSVNSIAFQWLYLISITLFIFLFLSCEINNVKTFRIIAHSLCFVGLFASILGIYEFSYFYTLGISDGPLIPYLLPPKVASRVGGFYGQANLFAVFLLCCFIAYCYAYNHSFSYKTILAKWFGWLPIVTVSVCFFMTRSMAGMIALLLFYCLFTYVAFQKSNHFYCTKKQYFKITLMLVGAYLVYWSLGITSANSIGLSKVGTSADARFIWWVSSFFMWLDNPWTGVGLGNFKFNVDEYMLQAHDLLGFVEYESMGYTNWAHNEFFQLLAEVGIVGIVIFLIFLLLLIRSIRKILPGASVEFYYCLFFMLPFVVSGMFSWPFRHAGLFPLFLFFLALIISWFPHQTVCLQCSWLHYGLKGIFIVMIISSCLVLRWENSLIKFYQAEKAAPQINLEAFQGIAGNQLNKYPLTLHLSPYYVQKILESKNMQQAEQLVPYLKALADTQGAHWQWYNLGVIYRLLGKLSEAEYALREAINRSPANDVYWEVLHMINLEVGLLEKGKTLKDYLSQGSNQIKFQSKKFLRPESRTINH